MAVRIRLMRMGKIRMPQYRIVVADSRTKRDGRAIEQVGLYHPKEDPSRIEVKSDRVQYWLGVGAQPSDPVKVLLCKTGDWQKFKGLPAPAPLKEPKAKADRNALYEAEAKAAGVGTETKKDEAPKKRGGGRRSGSDRAKSEAKTDRSDKPEKADKPATADKTDKPAKAEAAEATADSAKEA